VLQNLARLRYLGAEVGLARGPVVGRMQKLSLPEPPPLVQERADTFVCPNCGERLKIVLAGTRPVAEPPSPPLPMTAEPPPPAAGAEAPPGPVPLTPEEAATELEKAQSQTSEAAEAAPEQEPAPSAEAPPAEPVEEVEPVTDMPPAPPGQAPADDVAAESEPSSDTGPGIESGPYNVLVSGTGGTKKRQAIPLIMKYRGVTEAEAGSMAERTVVLLLEGVSRASADACAKELKSAGIRARIRKR